MKKHHAASTALKPKRLINLRVLSPPDRQSVWRDQLAAGLRQRGQLFGHSIRELPLSRAFRRGGQRQRMRIRTWFGCVWVTSHFRNPLQINGLAKLLLPALDLGCLMTRGSVGSDTSDNESANAQGFQARAEDVSSCLSGRRPADAP
jgi:hypothetical protein